MVNYNNQYVEPWWHLRLDEKNEYSQKLLEIFDQFRGLAYSPRPPLQGLDGGYDLGRVFERGM